MNKALATYRKLTKFPFGRRLFSFAVGLVAPYFSSIKPLVLSLEPNRCECLIKKRRAVHNHIKTVHVIAICNGLEMAMGVMAQASIPKHLRWIPKGMNVDYVAKATTNIRCVAHVEDDAWQVGDVPVTITAFDDNNVVVVRGQIKLWVSEVPKNNARND